MSTKVSYEEIETNIVIPLENLEEDIDAEFQEILSLNESLYECMEGASAEAMRKCVDRIVTDARRQMAQCVDLYVAQLKTVTGEFATLDEAIKSQLGDN